MEVRRTPEILTYRDEKGRLWSKMIWHEEIIEEKKPKNRCLAWMDDAPSPSGKA